MESMKNPQKEQALFQLYADAFSFVPGYLYILDTSGKLLNCNNNLLKKLGMDTLEDHGIGVIYKRMLEKGFGNEQQLLQFKKDDINTLLSEKPHTSDEPVPLWLHHEETRWFKVSRIPLRNENDKIEGLLVMMTDISEQKHLQEQLAKLKKELQNSNRRVAAKFDFDTQEFETEASPRVLLIEDNFLAQKAAKSVLMSCDCDVDVVTNEKELKAEFEPGNIDKLPRLTDYIIPKGVRIADTSRVRLGAYLSEGTTVMHEGFVNFNSGTLGPAMVEGRISAGVIVGKNSDLGGGSSTMGTLSGGNNRKISIGENWMLYCLPDN